MTAALRLELQAAANFTFAVEGEWFPRLEPIYKRATNPREVQEIRWTWEFRGCQLVATTPAGLWTGAGATIATLRTLLETRGSGHPTYARLVKSPFAGGDVLFTLGPSEFEDLQFELLEGESDPRVPGASWRTSATFTLRVSAVKKNADANGIVGFEQEVQTTYAGGRKRVEARTRITTKEGVSAVTKAQTYGRLDVTSFGSNYTYDTNGPAGIDYTYTDADEVNARTPTVCEVVSSVQEWGVDVGTTAGGTSPSEVGYAVVTRVTAKETVITTTVSARGPGYLGWVTARKPGGPLHEDELLDDRATKFAVGKWVQRFDRNTQQTIDNTTVSVEITGGHQTIDFEPIAGGYEPLEFRGALLPWQATVTCSVEKTGGQGRLSELRVPGLLSAPWVLDHNASVEGEPFRLPQEEGTDTAQQARWRREARYVYRSAKPPNGPLLSDLRAAPFVASHFIEHVS